MTKTEVTNIITAIQNLKGADATQGKHLSNAISELRAVVTLIPAPPPIPPIAVIRTNTPRRTGKDSIEL
ncbi:MAG: hypothetical protein ABSH14_08340 [Verrucomicrobiia bacterium]|jgi:hypothetical protein